jgi:hypothetical protein
MQASSVVLTEGMAAPALSHLLFDQSADLTSQVASKPLVVAFVSTFCEAGRADEADLERIRAEVRCLGATLLVLSPTVAWCFGPDDRLFKRVAPAELVDEELMRAFHEFGVSPFGLTEGGGRDLLRAVFVIDTAQTIRFAHAKALVPQYQVSSLQRPQEQLLRALVIAADAMEGAQKSARRPSLSDSAIAGLIAGFRQVVAPTNPAPARLRKSPQGNQRALPW